MISNCIQTQLAAMPNRQRGIVLFISLIVLVAMTLAGIAMMRQLGSGVGIAGNIAFRQNATTASDVGVEYAQNWLITKTAPDLQDDVTSQGYFASYPASFDPTSYGWEGAGKSASAGNDGNGNNVRYVIHRMCDKAGLTSDPTINCVTLDASLTPKAREGLDVGAVKILAGLTPYYRVTTRTTGPRGTISYTQVMMY